MELLPKVNMLNYNSLYTKSGMDREGVEAVIPCKYILKCYDSSYSSVLENLKKSLDSEDLSGPLAQ